MDYMDSIDINIDDEVELVHNYVSASKSNPFKIKYNSDNIDHNIDKFIKLYDFLSKTQERATLLDKVRIEILFYSILLFAGFLVSTITLSEYILILPIVLMVCHTIAAYLFNKLYFQLFLLVSLISNLAILIYITISQAINFDPLIFSTELSLTLICTAMMYRFIYYYYIIPSQSRLWFEQIAEKLLIPLMIK